MTSNDSIYKETISAKDAYDLLADKYDDSFYYKTSLAEDEIIYPKVKRFLGNSLTLDLGCGTGTLLEHISLSPRDYIGLDISPHMIERAQRKFPNHTFKLGDMANLPFDNESFDNVISMYCGISYADPKAFTEALRVLAPNGKFFFMLYNKQYSKRPTYILNRFNMKVPYHSYEDVMDFLPKCTRFGFNFHGDSLESLPKSIIKSILKIEGWVIGTLLPTRSYFMILEGEK